MSFRLLMMSTMYPGSLEDFYNNNAGLRNLNYDDHLSLLLNSSAEFAASYTRNFGKLGIDAGCIIANDKVLQHKWSSLESFKAKSQKELLLQQVKTFRPDILWIDNLSLIDEHWIVKLRGEVSSIKLVAGYHCSPVNSRVLSGLRGCDILFTCIPGLKNLFESYEKKTFLVYHGFDSDVSDHVTVNDNNKIEDIVFSGSLTTGNNFHQERIRLIEEILQSDIDMKLYANLEKRSRIIAKQLFYYTNSFFNLAGLSGFADRIKILEHGKSKIQKYSGKLLRQTLPPVYGSNMYNLFRNSKIVLNYHIGVAGNYAGNMRMFEVTGMGSCLLTDNKKNINDLFSPGNEVVVYDNPDDCISKVKWLLEHEDERQKIARAGQEKTLKNHTVEKRCESIIQIIQDQLNKV